MVGIFATTKTVVRHFAGFHLLYDFQKTRAKITWAVLELSESFALLALLVTLKTTGKVTLNPSDDWSAATAALRDAKKG